MGYVKCRKCGHEWTFWYYAGAKWLKVPCPECGEFVEFKP